MPAIVMDLNSLLYFIVPDMEYKWSQNVDCVAGVRFWGDAIFGI